MHFIIISWMRPNSKLKCVERMKRRRVMQTRYRSKRIRYSIWEMSFPHWKRVDGQVDLITRHFDCQIRRAHLLRIAWCSLLQHKKAHAMHILREIRLMLLLLNNFLFGVQHSVSTKLYVKQRGFRFVLDILIVWSNKWRTLKLFHSIDRHN